MAKTSYPAPAFKMMAECVDCDVAAVGGTKGAGNFNALMKGMKKHEDADHPPWRHETLIPALVVAVEELNEGASAPRRAGRYAIRPFRR